MSTVQGFDCSNWQANVDWRAIAASGSSFGICKACEGLSITDSYFAANWRGIKAAGLLRGAYMYARPEWGGSGADQARFFLSLIDGQGGMQPGDFLVLDIEAGNGELSAWCLDWLQTTEAHTGVRPWLYSGAWFIQGGSAHSLTDSRLANYPLWLSAYPTLSNPNDLTEVQKHWPSPPAPFPLISLWQFSERASCPGISGGVDSSIFNGTLDQMKKLCKQAPAPTPPPAQVYRYKVAVKHFLRIADEKGDPEVGDPHGAEVHVGDILSIATAPNPYPNVTSHWRYVSTASGSKGYALLSNLTPLP